MGTNYQMRSVARALDVRRRGSVPALVDDVMKIADEGSVILGAPMAGKATDRSR